MTNADPIDDLMEKSKKIRANGMTVRYALFSKSGYTKVAEMRAGMEGISLHRFDDMF